MKPSIIELLILKEINKNGDCSYKELSKILGLTIKIIRGGIKNLIRNKYMGKNGGKGKRTKWLTLRGYLTLNEQVENIYSSSTPQLE